MDGDLAVGLELLRRGEAGEAIPPLRRAAAHPLARLNLGIALMELGRLAEAEAELRPLHEAGADVPELSFRLGLLSARDGRTEAARALFAEAAPQHVHARVALARLSPSADEAAHHLALARAVAPEDPVLAAELASLRGDVEAVVASLAAAPDQGRLGEILAELLRTTPRDDVLDALGVSCAAAVARARLAGPNQEEALAQWRLAALLNPADPFAAAGLAQALAEVPLWGEAVEAFRTAIALKPDDLNLRLGLGNALFRLHRLAEAGDALRGATSCLGPHPSLVTSLSMILAAQGLHEEALALVRSLPEGEMRDLQLLAAIGPYAEEEGDAAVLAGHARSLHKRLSRMEAPPALIQRRGERIRLGVLSPGLGRHPVGWLTLAGLEMLPAEGFQLVICAQRAFDDPLNRRFRALASEWHDVPAGLTVQALAEWLRALNLDLLLELGGHGEGGRVSCLRYRPAPVTVKWVGAQAATTGVPGVDWMLTDRRETPAGFEPYYTERLLRLPDGYVCYTPPPYAPPVAPLPALSQGRVTFGCFNNLQKVTRGARRAWGEILRALPESRLVLRTHALGDAPTRDAFRRLAAEDGIPADRLELHGPLPHDRLLDAYGEVDVSLDAFPYSGGLTVCESLWMGVPVVSLAGTHFAGRHALSHLTSLGMHDWVADDREAYVRLAIAKAGDLAALAELRAGLRARMAASPLMDAPRFGRNLAAALRRALLEA